MVKRGKQGPDSLILQLDETKRKQEEVFIVLTNELKILNSIKKQIISFSKNMTAATKKNKKINADLVDLCTVSLHQFSKASQKNYMSEAAYNMEKQIRMQCEEQIAIMEEDVDTIESQLVEAKIENDQLSNTCDTLYERINFVKEAETIDSISKCERFQKVKHIIDSETFQNDFKKFQISLENLFEMVSPQENKEKLCIVCQTNKNDFVFIPCGHQCICEDCSKMVENRCPYCQTEASSINRLYPV